MNYLKEYIDFQNFDIQEEPSNSELGIYDFKINDHLTFDNILKPVIYWNSSKMIWETAKTKFYENVKIIDIKHSSEITKDINNGYFKIPDDTQEYLILLENNWPWFKLYNFKKLYINI